MYFSVGGSLVLIFTTFQSSYGEMSFKFDVNGCKIGYQYVPMCVVYIPMHVPRVVVNLATTPIRSHKHNNGCLNKLMYVH